MNENEFWLRFWRGFFIVFAILVFNIAGCTIHQNNSILKAIESGVSPERARIAFSSQVSDGEKIAAILTQEEK